MMGAQGDSSQEEHEQTPPTNGDAAAAPAPAVEDGEQQQLEQPDAQENNQQDGGFRGGNEDRKIFVGGIAYDVANEDLVQHFSQYGEVTQAQVKYDRATQRSRGFAFVEFATAEACKEALQHREQVIKQKQCEIKPAKSREVNKKVFVGGLPADFPEDELRAHFEAFGKVEDVEWPFDKQTKTRRNFAFIVFEEEDAADRAASVPRQTFGSREADVKKAVPQNKRNNFLFAGPGGPPRGFHLGAIRAYGAGVGGMRGPPYGALHHGSNGQWFGGSIAGGWPSLQYGAGGGGGWDWYGGAASNGAGSYYAAAQGGHSAASYGAYASNGFGHFDPHQGRQQHGQSYGASRHSQNGTGNGGVARFQAHPPQHQPQHQPQQQPQQQPQF